MVEVREGFSRWKAGQAEGSGAEREESRRLQGVLLLGWVRHPDT